MHLTHMALSHCSNSALFWSWTFESWSRTFLKNIKYNNEALLWRRSILLTEKVFPCRQYVSPLESVTKIYLLAKTFSHNFVEQKKHWNSKLCEILHPNKTLELEHLLYQIIYTYYFLSLLSHTIKYLCIYTYMRACVCVCWNQHIKITLPVNMPYMASIKLVLGGNCLYRPNTGPVEPCLLGCF